MVNLILYFLEKSSSIFVVGKIGVESYAYYNHIPTIIKYTYYITVLKPFYVYLVKFVLNVIPAFVA